MMRLWVFWLVVILLGCSAPSKQAAPTGPQAWSEIAQWQGNGMRDTETFDVASREWRVSWDVTSPGPAMNFIVNVMREGRDAPVAVAANVVNREASQESSVIRADPGRYYLKIIAANTDWSVAVEDQR